MPDDTILDRRVSAGASAALKYQSGFGNEFATEALPGALPVGQNSPQIPPYGLYTELLTGTNFTAPRGANRRSWLYRIRPSAGHPPFAEIDARLWRTAPIDEVAPPSQMRWNPLSIPSTPTDFIEGIATLACNGNATMQAGTAIHFYGVNRSMKNRALYDADGELMIVPQHGGLRIVSELGILEIAPHELAVVPRGVKFRVELTGGPASGFICENYGQHFRLPELGPIGASGLANPRDFLAPVAAFEESSETCELVAKFQGRLWATEIDHSPMNVVAWHGTNAPYKFNADHFNTINTVSFDHPDPSIATVMTSPSDTPGVANVDIAIFPERWMVAEHTFRPPEFHRNVASELFVLIEGVYNAKLEGLNPGGFFLHNSMSPHGPDAGAVRHAGTEPQVPMKFTNTLAFLFESRYPLRPTRFALEAKERQQDYWRSWQGIASRFTGRI